MANIVSSNNLTSLYGSGQTTILTSTPVPNVAGTIPSRNLTTLYSGSGNPVQAVLPYGNSNVQAFLNAGTDGSNTVQNIVATGNITANYYFGNGYYLTGLGNANVGVSNFANFAGNVTVSNQPNITQVGNLLNLTSNGNVDFANAGNVNLGSNTNVHISGGLANYALITDGLGNLSWGQVANASVANFANFAGNLINGTSNVNTNGANGNITISANGNSNILNVTGTHAIASNLKILANSFALGNDAGGNTQGFNSIALGNSAGNNQGNYGVAFGSGAGRRQGDYTISIGLETARGGVFSNTSSGTNTIAIGTFAGHYSVGNDIIAIGQRAKFGTLGGGDNSIAIGAYAGFSGSTPNAIAIGAYAGFSNSGSNSIAIGANAGYTNLGNNSIVLNATGSNLDQTTANTFTVKPVRNANTANVMFYDNATGEITYDLASNATIATANFANFAGNVTVNAQPNITSVGNLTSLIVTGNITSGNANLGNLVVANYFSGDGSLLTNINGSNISNVANANYANYSNIANIANSVNVANVVGIGNIATTNYDGNAGNVLYGNGGFFALPSISNVANANYANFAGVAYSVSGSNVTGTVANANYAAYAGQANTANLATYATTANSVAVANVVGIGNIATINLDGNSSNILYGNGVFSSVPNAVTANFANYAGNVTVNAQSNITTVGNLLTLNIVNATANSTQFLFAPNGTNVGVSGQNAASFVINQFNTQPGISNQVLNMQFTAARGNSTNPANVANTDYIGSMSWNSWNTNTYIRNARVTVLAPQGGNTAQWGNNVTWGAGSYFINTGNPLGNITSNTTLTTQNILGMTPFGALTLTPGAPGPNAAIQNALTLQSYGANTDGAGSVVNRILFQRSRGNRDSSTAVANTDGVGSFTFVAYNGNGYVGGASMYGTVNTTYGSIANGQPVPVGLNFSLTNGNGTIFTTALNPDGNVIFPAGNSVVAVNNLNVGATGGTNGLLKLSNYTAAALRAITGSIGQMAAVSDSSSGLNPNGRIAFWDTTNSRWSYVNDNLAV